MKKFSRETAERVGWYVYRLIDPTNGETFYVGKGKDNRVFDHVSLELSEQPDEDLKKERISRIVTIGLKPIYLIHRHGIPTEQAAFEVEAALIDAYPGLTNAVGGHGSGVRGCMSAQQVEELYRLAEAQFPSAEKILLIIVNRSATDGKPLIEATAGDWKLNQSRAARADIVLAVVDGAIREAYRLHGNLIQVGDRWRLPLVEADEEVRSRYRNKRVPGVFRKPGSANPIRYNYK